MVKIPLCIIGPSNYFKSGLSTYSTNLVDIFVQSKFFHVSALFLNKFIPKKLFPGKNRNPDDYPLIIPANVPFFNGLDWFIFPSLIKSFKFLSSLKTDQNRVFLLQWWTSSVLHIYLTFVYSLKFIYPQSKIILEIHEVFDPLEQKIKPLGFYVRLFFPLLLNKVDYLLFHSKQEVSDFSTRFKLDESKIRISKHILPAQQQQSVSQTRASSDIFTILSFGLIRDYKGIPLLIKGFNAVMSQLDSEKQKKIQLLIVGEIWDEKDLILTLIKSSPFKHQIKLRAKYVPDSAIPDIFLQSDLLVLPYRRGTQSGVIHLGMNYHLPIITTDVGGFAEALANYDSKIIVEPNNLSFLVEAMHSMILTLMSSYRFPQVISSSPQTTHVNSNFINKVFTLTKS